MPSILHEKMNSGKTAKQNQSNQLEALNYRHSKNLKISCHENHSKRVMNAKTKI